MLLYLYVLSLGLIYGKKVTHGTGAAREVPQGRPAAHLIHSAPTHPPTHWSALATHNIQHQRGTGDSIIAQQVLYHCANTTDYFSPFVDSSHIGLIDRLFIDFQASAAEYKSDCINIIWLCPIDQVQLCGAVVASVEVG